MFFISLKVPSFHWLPSFKICIFVYFLLFDFYSFRHWLLSVFSLIEPLSFPGSSHCCFIWKILAHNYSTTKASLFVILFIYPRYWHTFSFLNDFHAIYNFPVLCEFCLTEKDSVVPSCLQQYLYHKHKYVVISRCVTGHFC